jgi:hypothetical protein
MSAFSWLGIRYVDRTFFDKAPSEATIQSIRSLLNKGKAQLEESIPTKCRNNISILQGYHAARQ